MSRQPLLWSSLAFAAGLFVGSHTYRSILLWLIAAFVFALSGIYFLRRRAVPAFGLMLTVMFVGGSLLIQVRSPKDVGRSEILPFTNGGEVVVIGHVAKEGEREEKDFGEEVQKIDVETEKIDVGGITSNVRAGLRLSIYSKQLADIGTSGAAHTFRYGERVRFPVKLSLPRNFRNPGAFDYEGYLAENGIAALGSTKRDEVAILPGFSGHRFELWRTRVHRSLIDKIHALWPSEQAALIDTIMLGDDTFLGKGARTNFQRTGTYHVLVVSGLKVGILALVMFWLLRRLRVNDLAASVITVGFIVSYAVLTDVGTPVWRATLMLMLYLATRLLFRDRAILNTIGAAALVLLIIDPSQ